MNRKTKAIDLKKGLFGIISLILVGGITLIWLSNSAEKVRAGWFDDLWGYRKIIPITAHTAAEGGVYINLTGAAALDTSATGRYKANCGDLRFTDYSGKMLQYYISSGCGTSNTVVHVYLDSFPAGASDYYYYYGNPNASDGFSATDFATAASNVTIGTIGSEETTVKPVLSWKFDEGNGTSAKDSSGGGRNGTITGATFDKNTNTANNNSALKFSGSGQYVSKSYSSDTPLDPSTGSFGVSAWFRHPASAPSASPLHQFKMNDNAASTAVVDSAGSATGISQRNTSLMTTTGKINNALALNGSTDYIQLNSLAVDSVTTNAKTTVSFWMYWTGTLEQMPFAWDASYYDLYINTNCFGFNTGNADCYGVAVSALTANQWVHVVAIFNNGALSSNSLYINGAAQTLTQRFGAGQTHSIATSARVGNWQAGAEAFGGNIDDVRIYNGALTPGQISQLYNSGSGTETTNFTGTMSSLVARYSSGGYKLYMDTSGYMCFGIDDGATWTPKDSVCTGASLGSLADANWHQVEAVKNGTSSISIYIDGKFINSLGTLTATTSISGSSPTFYVGVDSDGTNNFWTGYIDEVKVYSGARTSAQIKADYLAKTGNSGQGSSLGSQHSNASGDGLSSYWKLDELSGNLSDSSGNSYTGTWTGNGASHYTVGKFGYGSGFNGTDDYIQTTSSTVKTADNFTLSAWFKTTSTACCSMILWEGEAAGNGFGSQAEMNLSIGNGDTSTSNVINFFLANGIFTTDANALNCQTPFSTTNTWTHVAVVVSNMSTSPSCNLYINGVFQVSDTGSSSTTVRTTWDTNLRIGRPGASTRYFSGTIDDVKVYSRALNSKEVNTSFYSSPAPDSYWNFEDSDASTSVRDISGNENLGTWSGSGTSHWVQGKFGRAGQFDGSTDYITAGTSTSLDLINSFTIAFWSKLGNPSQANEYVLNKRAAGGDNYAIIYGFTSNKYEIYSDLYSGTAPRTALTSTVTDTGWHHIAWTYDGVKLVGYLDGVVNVVSPKTFSFGNGSSTFRFASSTGGSGSFNGSLDEVKIYKYARTPSQIVSDMNGNHPIGGSPVGSQANYWKFDDGFGNVASDSGTQRSNANLFDMASPPSIGTSGWQVNGKFFKGVAFDGVNDRIDLGDLPHTEGISSMSATFWVNPNSLVATKCLLCKYNNAATQRSYAIETGTSNASAIRVTIPASTTEADGTTYGETPTGTLSVGSWAHVAVVYDGGASGSNANALKVYVNGILQQLTFGGTIPGSTQATTSDAMLGAASDNGGRYFFGQMDEVKIYLGALSQSDVILDMNRGSGLSLGAFSTSLDGKSASPSGYAIYCVPGDTSTCNPPIGDWNFEEGQGSVVNDLSGKANNAIWNGTLGSQWTKGLVGNAGNFNGSDNYVDAGGAATAFNLAAGALTFSAWIYPTSVNFLTNNAGGVVVKKNSYYGILRNVSGVLYYETYLYGLGSPGYHRSKSSIPLNTWTQVATIWDGTNVRIYINGRQDNFLANSGSLTDPGTYNLTIGWDGGASDFFIGKIDRVQVYNYARSNQQMAWSYDNGKPLTQMKFDECSGTTLNGTIGTVSGTLTVGASGSQTSAGTCATASTAWGSGAAGKFNYSLNFDGTDDYVSSSNMPMTSLMGGQAYSAWIKTSTSGEQGIMTMSSAAPAGATSDRALRLTSNNFAEFRICNVSASLCSNATGSRALNDGNWHFIVGVADGTNASVYVDGRLEGRTASAYQGRNDLGSAPKWNIGMSRNNADNALVYFAGQIDEPMAYSYAPTLVQIATMYNQSAAVRFGPSSGAP